MPDPWSGSSFGGSSAYDQLFKQIMGNVGPGGFQWNQANTQSKLDQYGNDFAQQFQNTVGRAPTASEINQFFSQAVSPIMSSSAGFSGTNPLDIVSQYIPQAYQSQIQQNQQAQLPNLENQISNLATGVAGQTSSQLSDPNSPIYRQFSGAMNDLGITPSSGAFQAGLGSTIGQSASGAIQQGLEGLGFPAIGGNQSPTFQSLYGQGQTGGSNVYGANQNMMDFFMQKDLADSLSGNAPSNLGSNILMGALSGAGTGAKLGGPWGAAGGAAAGAGLGAGVSKSGTWICSQLRKLGLLTQDEVNQIHAHLYRAFWKKPFKFLGYLCFGKLLVALGNRACTDWEVWKPEFYDNVMAESDPVKAVEIYEDAFSRLFQNVRVRLKHSYRHHGYPYGF